MGSDTLVYYTGVLAAAEALDPHPNIEILSLQSLHGGADRMWSHGRVVAVVKTMSIYFLLFSLIFY
jgi:hypothetical protein